MKTIDTLIQKAGINKIDQLIITCVDPKYPVASMGVEFADTGVSYTPNDHELGGHVQLAPEDATQVFLRYVQQNDTFESITQEEVHASLPRGVIQIAYLEGGTTVMGIPGDALAFSPRGPGFAFGRPGDAPAAAAERVLRSLLGLGVQSIALMSHHDCGAYANSIGKELACAHELKDWKEKGFIDRTYQHAEAQAKIFGASYVQRIANAVPVRIVSPAYEKRRPGVLAALEGGHE